jgi:molybdenum cofactor synthesis domain-containing protein
MTIKIEIICIGNELLIGKIQNTNAHWLAKQATQLGATVTRITVIQDNIDEIAAVIKEAKARKPNFIITTGGLGPTFDDMTLQGIASALNRPLEVNNIALEMVKQRTIKYLEKRGLPTEVEMTPPRLKMARFPKETAPVTNPFGTAPGLRADMKDTVLFVLPGVPMEMESIFTETIAPLIVKMVGQCVFCQRSLFVEDIFESHLAPLIDMVMKDNVGVYIKSHPIRSENKPHLELHLTICSDQKNHPSEKLNKATEEIAALIACSGGRVVVEP